METGGYTPVGAIAGTNLTDLENFDWITAEQNIIILRTSPFQIGLLNTRSILSYTVSAPRNAAQCAEWSLHYVRETDMGQLAE